MQAHGGTAPLPIGKRQSCIRLAIALAPTMTGLPCTLRAHPDSIVDPFGRHMHLPKARRRRE